MFPAQPFCLGLGFQSDFKIYISTLPATMVTVSSTPWGKPLKQMLMPAWCPLIPFEIYQRSGTEANIYTKYETSKMGGPNTKDSSLPYSTTVEENSTFKVRWEQLGHDAFSNAFFPSLSPRCFFPQSKTTSRRSQMLMSFMVLSEYGHKIA